MHIGLNTLAGGHPLLTSTSSAIILGALSLNTLAGGHPLLTVIPACGCSAPLGAIFGAKSGHLLPPAGEKLPSHGWH